MKKIQIRNNLIMKQVEVLSSEDISSKKNCCFFKKENNVP